MDNFWLKALNGIDALQRHRTANTEESTWAGRPHAEDLQNEPLRGQELGDCTLGARGIMRNLPMELCRCIISPRLQSWGADLDLEFLEAFEMRKAN